MEARISDPSFSVRELLLAPANKKQLLRRQREVEGPDQFFVQRLYFGLAPPLQALLKQHQVYSRHDRSMSTGDPSIDRGRDHGDQSSEGSHLLEHPDEPQFDFEHPGDIGDNFPDTHGLLDDREMQYHAPEEDDEEKADYIPATTIDGSVASVRSQPLSIRAEKYLEELALDEQESKVFQDLVSGKSRVAVARDFLRVLELTSKGRIRTTQKQPYGSIILSPA